MSDNDFDAAADVAVGDLRLSIGEAIKKVGELVPAKRFERFQSLTAEAAGKVQAVLDGRQKQLEQQLDTLERGIDDYLLPRVERTEVQQVLDYMRQKDLRSELAALDAHEVRKLVISGIERGDDSFLNAAAVGLKPLANADFLQQQRAIHRDNRLRQMDQGHKFLDGRKQILDQVERFQKVRFKVARQARELLEAGGKAAVNQPAADPAQPRSYAEYKTERDALAAAQQQE